MIRREHIEVVTNLHGPGREETLQGTTYRVVPATLVRSQVLTNNVGRCYLPPEAFTEKWAAQANGSPVVTDHPKQRGVETTARRPAVLNEMGIGWLFEVEVKGEELVGEVWLNEGRAEDVEDLAVVLERLADREDVELSTGFPALGERRSGMVDNEEFDLVIYPDGFDHLAVFAEKRGACSVEDGCGLHANVHNQSAPEFSGTEDVSPEWADGEWARPALSDHPEAGEGDQWEDLDEGDRAAIAARFVVGSADAETYGDLSYPAVNPSTGRLNRNGVLAGRQRASAQGDTEVSEILDGLWEEHFADEEEEDAENMAANEGALRRVWMQLQRIFGNQGEFSLDDRREAIREAARSMFGGPNTFVWVEEMFDDTVVLGIETGGESTLQRVEYTVDEEARTVTLGTELEEVEKVTEFVSRNGRIEARHSYLATNPTEGVSEMNREEMISRLSGCDSVPFTRERLEDMSDEELAFAANAAGITNDAAEGGAEGGSGEGGGEGAAATATVDPDEEDGDAEPPAWARKIIDGVQENASAIQDLREETSPVRHQAQQERKKLTSEIISNSEYTEEDLEGKPLTELRKLHALAERKGRNYVGLGFPRTGDEAREGDGDLGFEPVSTMNAGPGKPIDADDAN